METNDTRYGHTAVRSPALGRSDSRHESAYWEVMLPEAPSRNSAIAWLLDGDPAIRWITLRALRVMDWYARRAHDVNCGAQS